MTPYTMLFQSFLNDIPADFITIHTLTDCFKPDLKKVIIMELLIKIQNISIIIFYSNSLNDSTQSEMPSKYLITSKMKITKSTLINHKAN